MLQNPVSLSVMVLKARYYPNSELLVAGVGSSPSQVWRTIHTVIGELKQVLVRGIGMGKTQTRGMISGYQQMDCCGLWLA
jgi:hypothetical protein